MDSYGKPSNTPVPSTSTANMPGSDGADRNRNTDYAGNQNTFSDSHSKEVAAAKANKTNPGYC